MSKIGDDLREFADAEALNPIQISILKHMAKRIDNEMVELPWSADGQIWTGREVCFWEGTEFRYHRLYEFVRKDGRWYVEDTSGFKYAAESVWYEYPDNLERIANELEKWCDSVDVDGDACGKPRYLAKRIRRLAEMKD